MELARNERQSADNLLRNNISCYYYARVFITKKFERIYIELREVKHLST
jgi:hypothetical protein